jgi:hypothetical protein
MPSNATHRHVFMCSKGTYELVDTPDGEWVHCVSGHDWIMAVYLAPWVRLVSSDQTIHDNEPHQRFDTGLMDHEVGELLAYDDNALG